MVLLQSGHIQIMNDTVERGKSKHIGHRVLIIYNVSKEDEGEYYCHVRDHSQNTNQAVMVLKVYSKC